MQTFTRGYPKIDVFFHGNSDNKMDDLGYPHFSGNPPGMGVKHENFWDINGLINDI
jgi:hypothetical protein